MAGCAVSWRASVPDLKDSVGGLRDAAMLRALVASWLVDVPHGELEGRRLALLDVRDALHAAAGRATDRVAPELWGGIADLLGLPALPRPRGTPVDCDGGLPMCPVSRGGVRRLWCAARSAPDPVVRGWIRSLQGWRSPATR